MFKFSEDMEINAWKPIFRPKFADSSSNDFTGYSSSQLDCLYGFLVLAIEFFK